MRTPSDDKHFLKFGVLPDRGLSMASNLICDMSFWSRANGKRRQLGSSRLHISSGTLIPSSGFLGTGNLAKPRCVVRRNYIMNLRGIDGSAKLTTSCAVMTI